MKFLIGARSSPLSRAQFEEMRSSLVHELIPVWVETTGDLDKKTSLRDLDKTNFFTKELDAMLLEGKIRAAVHSAKDLPDPLPLGLSIVALTTGKDSRDSLVFRRGENLEMAATIATSSQRREEIVRSLRPGLKFVDLRGTIGERLSLLEKGLVDGVVVAEAALIRLGLTHLNRMILPGDTASLQGRLAVVARTDDEEMRQVFASVDARKILYLGLNPKGKDVLHYPVIRTEKIASFEEARLLWDKSTHVIFTSQTAVRYWNEEKIPLDKIVISVGKATANLVGRPSLIANPETQEGVIALLETMDLQKAFIFWPKSKKARPVLTQYLQEKKIPYYALDLYDTVFQKLEPVPNLMEVKEIVFTSPSTVEGFLRIYGSFPPGIRYTAIGPVTERAISSCLHGSGYHILA